MPNSLTLMAVHAHPDDEASSTGGVLARYASEGVRTVLVTCTNGELGDGPGHVKPDEDGHDPDAVKATRLGELKVSCDALGVSDLELLGYHDSGMADWRHRHREDVFCSVDLEEPVGRLVTLFETYRPDVVVTYDERRGYNHPDHVQAHRITVAAVERTGIPSKLYFTARRRRDFGRIREILAEQGVDLPGPASAQPDPERLKRMEEAEARITTVIDVNAFAQAKRASLAAHASQLDMAWWLKIPPELVGEVFAVETFIRAHDTTGAPTPEDDLFAGLR